MKRIFVYADVSTWHSFYIKNSDILKETANAYFIHTHDLENEGRGIWISKKLVRPSGNGYKVSVGNDFTIKPIPYEKSHYSLRDKQEGNFYIKLYDTLEKEWKNGKEFANDLANLQKIEKDIMIAKKVSQGTHDEKGRDLRDYSELINKLESRLENYVRLTQKTLKQCEGINDNYIKSLLNEMKQSLLKAESSLKQGKESNYYGKFKDAESSLKNVKVISDDILMLVKKKKR